MIHNIFVVFLFEKSHTFDISRLYYTIAIREHIHAANLKTKSPNLTE